MTQVLLVSRANLPEGQYSRHLLKTADSAKVGGLAGHTKLINQYRECIVCNNYRSMFAL